VYANYNYRSYFIFGENVRLPAAFLRTNFLKFARIKAGVSPLLCTKKLSKIKTRSIAVCYALHTAGHLSDFQFSSLKFMDCGAWPQVF
jgi:hypothetical protein